MTRAERLMYPQENQVPSTLVTAPLKKLLQLVNWELFKIPPENGDGSNGVASTPRFLTALCPGNAERLWARFILLTALCPGNAVVRMLIYLMNCWSCRGRRPRTPTRGVRTPWTPASGFAHAF